MGRWASECVYEREREVDMCVYACVIEREKEKERDRDVCEDMCVGRSENHIPYIHHDNSTVKHYHYH